MSYDKATVKLPLFFKLSLLSGFLLPTLTYIFCYAPFSVSSSQASDLPQQHIIVQNQVQSSGVVLSAESEHSTHTVRFFDESLFFPGVQSAQQSVIPHLPFAQIKGGITPHHLLASTILSRFFSTLKTTTPSTIVILGPNHNELGNYPLLTSQYDWETPFGIAQHDDSLTQQLLTKQIAQVDETLVPTDHSVTDTIPYITYYLPQTKVIPILISNKMNLEEIENLANQLYSVMPEDAVVVAAVDFSHYLPANQADQKDLLTERLMRDHEYEKIMTLSNDYVDAPATIVLFLKLMGKMNALDTVTLDHTNSGHLLNDQYTPTTSYFSILFGKN